MIVLIVVAVVLLILLGVLLGIAGTEKVFQRRDRQQAAAQKRINEEWKLLRAVREENDDPEQ
ncbi:hypothetical protein [Actinokineospora bangkokensis]|uniref:hypothetical protein n=1 Tax=Actinokineospora bangkokensis TaxID=1193682 RepID=UPI001177BCB9|nr:hypothetical protein [Actinokineospora bangkokensis]